MRKTVIQLTAKSLNRLSAFGQKQTVKILDQLFCSLEFQTIVKIFEELVRKDDFVPVECGNVTF